MKYIRDKKDLDGKIVILRLDLNVPIKNGKIVDETRMQIRIIFIYITFLDNFNDLVNLILYKNIVK